MDQQQASIHLGELPIAELAQLVALLEKASMLNRDGVQTLSTINFVINITLVSNQSNSGNTTTTTHTSGGSQANVAVGDHQKVTSTTNFEAKQALEQELEKLTQLVAELCKRLPEEDARDAKEDLATLKQQAARQRPREDRYAVSAKGLLNAAKAVVDMTPSIETSVQAVLKLLSGA